MKKAAERKRIRRHGEVENSYRCERLAKRYIPVIHLTRQEQIVICVIALLLLTGWAVKMYRTANPPPVTAVEPAELN